MNCFRWKTNIPAPVSDQVYHAVAKPQTVKNTKVGYISSGCQMV